MFGTAEERHAAMARLGKASSGDIAALFVVAEYLRAARALDVFVEDHHAPVRLVDQLGEQPVCGGMVGDENQSVEMIAAETLQIFLFSRALVERDAKHEREAVPIGRALRRGRQQREIGVGDVGNDEANRIRPPAAETARMRVGLVAQFLDDALDPLGRSLRQLDAAIDVPRNRRDRNAGALRHVDQTRYPCRRHEIILVNSLHGKHRPILPQEPKMSSRMLICGAYARFSIKYDGVIQGYPFDLSLVVDTCPRVSGLQK